MHDLAFISTDTNITAADNQAEIQEWHTMLMIEWVRIENHRCTHTILCFVNTAGGISLLALLVNYISDIADIHDGQGE